VEGTLLQGTLLAHANTPALPRCHATPRRATAKNRCPKGPIIWGCSRSQFQDFALEFKGEKWHLEWQIENPSWKEIKVARRQSHGKKIGIHRRLMGVNLMCIN
jgi:hypothetical protein